MSKRALHHLFRSIAFEARAALSTGETAKQYEQLAADARVRAVAADAPAYGGALGSIFGG